MSASTAYTPLEALLFFQYLSTVGVDPSSFSKISDSLKENEFIRDAKTFDAGRLSPDSLRELYLNLLKEEFRSENDGAHSDRRDVVGDQDPQNLRKRKLPSPPLASVSDAARHIHLLPQLVTRLYVRYRQIAIQGIREDERRYDSLKRDIEEIERGRWDDRLERRQDTVSNELSSTRPVGEGHNARGDLSSFLNDNPSTPASTSVIPLLGKDPLTSSKEQQSDAHGPGARNASHDAGVGSLQSNQHGPTVAPHYTRPEFPPYHRAIPLATNSYSKPNDGYTVAQSTPRPPPQFGPVDGNLSYLPPPHHSAHGYRLGSSSSDGHRSLPFPPPLQEPSTSSLRSPDAVHTPASAGRASASPVILPPPPGMHRTPGPSTRPLDALADMAGQHYRPHPPPQPLRNNQMPPTPQQHQQGQLSQPRGYFQSQYQFPARQPAYTGPYQTHTPQRMTSQYSPVSGPSSLPPFQSFSPVPGQPPGQAQRHQAQQQQHRASLPAYVHNSGPSMPYVYNPSFNQSPKLANAGQQSTFSTPSDKRRLPQLSPLDTSGSSTKWKTVSLPGLPKSPGSPTPPGPEDVSPISEPAPSPEQIPLPEKKSSNSRADVLKHSAETPEAVEHRAEEKAASEKGNTNKRGGRGRVSTPRGRGRGRGRGRAGSTASSAIADSAAASTRSQSVLSHADELSMDTGTVKARKIKNEPPATPAGIVGDEDSEMAAPTPDESSHVSTRPRRGTFRSSETATESTGTSKKRKRGSQATPEDTNTNNLSMTLPSLNRSDYVLASRNFPRTSATIMNDVTGHKLASLFAKPLTEREAPGYKDLIYRPQDLKSIKSAISAGSRAVAAAADNTTAVGTPAGEAGSPGQGASTPSAAANKNASLWIPKTADVVPPKGIVNSAQLERELMRMFANAVMFNPDTNRAFGPAFRFRETAGADDDDDDDGDGGAGEEGQGAGTEDGDEGDEGGVVRDTREMFAAVEKSVAAWRAAERAAEEAGGGRAAVPTSVPVPVGLVASRLRGGGEEREKEKEKEEDEADELAGDEGGEESGKGRERDDGESQSQGQGSVKRRRRA